MNKTEQESFLSDIQKRSFNTLANKGADYASDKDVLGNFKRLSSVVKTLGIDIKTPTGYALFMTLLKIDRINNLISENKDPKNESVEDSFLDGINYMKLAWMCYEDEHKGK